MCKFLSAICFKNGDVICSTSIDSHEILIETNGLKDGKSRNWVRAEYCPDKPDDFTDISKYKFHLDDSDFDWITDELREKWIRKFNVRLKKIIITDDRNYLPTGDYILGNITIDRLTYGRIVYAGYATIEDAGHATIGNAGYATIINKNKAKITK